MQARDMERCLEWYPRISTLTGNNGLGYVDPSWKPLLKHKWSFPSTLE